MESHYKNTNVHPIFNSPNFVSVITKKVQSKLNRNLNDGEMRFIMNFVRSLTDDIPRMPINDAILGISNAVIKKFSEFKCVTEIDDTHEMLKGEMGLKSENSSHRIFNPESKYEQPNIIQPSQSLYNEVDIKYLFGTDNELKIQEKINPLALYRTITILLDTRYRKTDSNGTTYFSWDYVNSAIRNQGSVNAIGKLQNILSMKVFPFMIPHNSTSDTQYKKISMLIRELSAQSVIAHENRRFHFIFDTEISGNYIKLLTENNNDGVFKFNKQITNLDNITIEFGNPLESIIFDIDRAIITSISYGTQTHFTTSIPHNLLTGDIIYIENFTTTNINQTNDLISNINLSTGNNAIVVSSTEFKINIDSTAVFNLIETGGTIYIETPTNIQEIGGFNPLSLIGIILGDIIRITGTGLDVTTSVIAIGNTSLFVVNPIPVVSTPTNPLTYPLSVYKDYRLPNSSYYTYKQNLPLDGVSLTNSTTVSGGISFLSDFKVGDIFYMGRTDNVGGVNGPRTVTNIISNSVLESSPASADILNTTIIKQTQQNIPLINVYFGSKRIFITMELTYKEQT